MDLILHTAQLTSAHHTCHYEHPVANLLSQNLRDALFVHHPVTTCVRSMLIARLSPKTLEAHAGCKHQSKPLAPYPSMGELIATLDRWTKKWATLRNDKNESATTTVLRLASELSRDDNVLQVRLTQSSLCI